MHPHCCSAQTSNRSGARARVAQNLSRIQRGNMRSPVNRFGLFEPERVVGVVKEKGRPDRIITAVGMRYGIKDSSAVFALARPHKESDSAEDIRESIKLKQAVAPWKNNTVG